MSKHLKESACKTNFCILTYLFGAVMANIVLGFVVQHFGWHIGFVLLTVISILAMLCFILTWNKRGQEQID